MTDLLDDLIRSEALAIAPPGEVFWYTSGTLGPYYIRTHYLCGGPARAEEVLAFIDGQARAADFHARLQARLGAILAADAGYRRVVADLAEAIERREAGGRCCDWISGGERRDWFFSLPVAEALGRPHLYIYKDGAAVLAAGSAPGPVDALHGRRTAHVADLVTEASSYTRAWIPALRERGGNMAVSANVVDRAQGGMDALRAAGVDALALLRVDEGLFADLFDRGLVDLDQHALLVAYFRDPTTAMRLFLLDHPAFLESALASTDAKTVQRARMLVGRDPYGLHAS